MRQHGNDLGVARWGLAAGSRWSKDFGANLIELPVAALLRTLTAKLRPNVIKLLQLAGITHLVFDIGPHHAGGIFRSQRQRLRFFTLRARLVLPGKHLL